MAELDQGLVILGLIFQSFIVILNGPVKIAHGFVDVADLDKGVDVRGIRFQNLEVRLDPLQPLVLDIARTGTPGEHRYQDYCRCDHEQDQQSPADYVLSFVVVVSHRFLLQVVIHINIFKLALCLFRFVAGFLVGRLVDRFVDRHAAQEQGLLDGDVAAGRRQNEVRVF